jgi:hypothetical protein
MGGGSVTAYDPHTDWGMAPVLDVPGTTPKPRAESPREDDR